MLKFSTYKRQSTER